MTTMITSTTPINPGNVQVSAVIELIEVESYFFAPSEGRKIKSRQWFYVDNYGYKCKVWYVDPNGYFDYANFWFELKEQ